MLIGTVASDSSRFRAVTVMVSNNSVPADADASAFSAGAPPACAAIPQAANNSRDRANRFRRDISPTRAVTIALVRNCPGATPQRELVVILVSSAVPSQDIMPSSVIATPCQPCNTYFFYCYYYNITITCLPA